MRIQIIVGDVNPAVTYLQKNKIAIDFALIGIVNAFFSPRKPRGPLESPSPSVISASESYHRPRSVKWSCRQSCFESC